MAGYITLYKFTAQGIANIKGSPERIQRAKAFAQSMGVRVVGVWTTTGQYDMVVIADAPDDKTLIAVGLAIVGQGNVTSETMRAFSEEEWAEVVSRIPQIPQS